MTRARFSPFAASCLLALALGALACGIFAALLSKAGAHDALPTAAKPQGWSCPFSCCSGYDCREVPAKAIGSVAGADDSRTICLFVPPRGF